MLKEETEREHKNIKQKEKTANQINTKEETKIKNINKKRKLNNDIENRNYYMGQSIHSNIKERSLFKVKFYIHKKLS